MFACYLEPSLPATSRGLQRLMEQASRWALRDKTSLVLTYVIEPTSGQHWMGIERLLEAESTDLAHDGIQAAASIVNAHGLPTPMTQILHGAPAEALAKWLETQPEVTALFLTPYSSDEAPQRVWDMISKLQKKIAIPVVVV